MMVRATQLRTTSHFSKYFLMQDGYAFCSPSQETNCHFESLKTLKVHVTKGFHYDTFTLSFHILDAILPTTTLICIYFCVFCHGFFFK